MRQDNRGLSLVEIMVVIAIIAVVGGVGIWGVGAITGRPAQQCAQKIVYSLERHRTTSMSKLKADYVLWQDSVTGKVYVNERVTNDKTKDLSAVTPITTEIGASGMKVTYVCSDGDTVDLATSSLNLGFDRSSGAFKQQSDGSYCTKIIVERGGRSFEVTLVPFTGKVYID